MIPPPSLKLVSQFIGSVNYYRNMRKIFPHALAQLPTITSIKKKFKWNKIKQDTFKELKRLVARGVLLAYPDFYE